MDGGGGEQSDNESRTPSQPNMPRNAQSLSSIAFTPIEKWIPYCKSFSFQELLHDIESGKLPSATRLPNDGNGFRSGAAAQNRPASYTPPVPSQHSYNLNSTPEAQLYGIPNFAPITPDKSVRSYSLNLDDTAHHETEKKITTTLECQPPENNLIAANPTEFQENQNTKNADSNEIEASRTPQQKQRRKKHRPKVITEHKPRTPKPETPATKENPTGKRKYVRKNPKEKALETPSDAAGRGKNSKKRSPRKKSCRRALNFDEMDMEDEYSGCSYFNVDSEPQGHRCCTSSISKVTVQLCKGIKEVTVRNTQGNLDGDTPVCPTSPTDSDSSTTITLTEGNEYKGNYSHAISHANSGSINMSELQYNSVQAYHLISWQNNKKKRSDKGANSVASNAAFCDAEKYFGVGAMEQDGKKISGRVKRAQKNLQNDQSHGCIVIDLSAHERPTKKRSRNATRARDLASLERIAPQSTANSYCPEQTESCIDALIAQTRATLARRKRTKMRNLPVVHYSALQQSYPFSGFPQEVPSTMIVTIEDIERQLKCLDINKESCRFVCPQENAIVPFLTRYKENNTLVLYKGDGMMVPFTPAKKPRPRPKVDLDEETTRVWKLLLENINSEGIDGTNEEKAKWWEEERKVFRGRADSFIARMHLVQGDRRFSKWKGSVLDSVVGVFLTQNVSDHLSSSAYMSLAARYPLTSKNCNKACVVSNESEVCVLENIPNQPVCGSSFTLDDAETTRRDAEENKINQITGSDGNETTGSNTTACSVEQEHKAISVQQYVFCSTSQTTNKTGSSSESNSHEDDLANRCKPDSLEDPTSMLKNLHVDEPSVLQVAPDKKLKDDCIESRAVEHDNSSQSMNKADPKSSKESSTEPSSSHSSCELIKVDVSIIESFELYGEKTQSSDISQSKLENSANDQSTITMEFTSQNTIQTKMTETLQEGPSCPGDQQSNTQVHIDTFIESQSTEVENLKNFETMTQEKPNGMQQNLPNHSDDTQAVVNHTIKSDLKKYGTSLNKEYSQIEAPTLKSTSGRVRKEKADQDWDQLRKQAEAGGRRQRTEDTIDSLDWEALRCADVNEVANTIKERGMNNRLAQRIQDFLNRLVKEHGDINLEWLRDVPPDQAKEYLLSIRGLGLKSVECVRLLTLHHLAFPVDTNVGRIAVRLGWVPLQPLPESLQLHLLELYPVLETIQKYLWPRLCKLDQRTLYELHYQMITFGKVFCTKNKPNCNACPMRGECRHFASAFASARLALPGPEEKSIVITTGNVKEDAILTGTNEGTPLLLPPATEQLKEGQHLVASNQSGVPQSRCCEPIIEEPATPEPECTLGDIEDFLPEDPDEIPTIKLNIEEFTQNLQNYMQKNMELQDGDMSKALVALGPEAASIPMPKLKNVNRLRTEHQVYELPDTHPLLERLQMEKREPDDPSPYLLAIWTPGETPNSTTPPEKRCGSQALGKLCNHEDCFSCNSVREANSQTVRGTLLIPCRTAMRGSFPLNGTYFQVNEVFADNDSSLNPIEVPRAWIWNLQRRTVYFGTSIPTIFRGLTTEGIQHCFWRGYVCVRGFDQKHRAPRPLMARLHLPASKAKRTRDLRAEE